MELAVTLIAVALLCLATIWLVGGHIEQMDKEAEEIAWMLAYPLREAERRRRREMRKYES